MARLKEGKDSKSDSQCKKSREQHKKNFHTHVKEIVRVCWEYIQWCRVKSGSALQKAPCLSVCQLLRHSGKVFIVHFAALCSLSARLQEQLIFNRSHSKMGSTGGRKNAGWPTNVRVAVIGDSGTGKSSLIVTVASDTFPVNVPSVVQPTRIPQDYYPDRIPLTIIDTSSKPEDSSKMGAEYKRADAIVLTYACDQPSTLDRLSTYWLPELRRLEVKAPVVVVGCKLDLREEASLKGATPH